MKKAIAKIRGSKKGFTLMEMLIVVAIIAVLVAIAVPVMNTQLDNAKRATDQANIRSAVAMASIKYLDGTATTTDTYYFQNDGTLSTVANANTYILKVGPNSTAYPNYTQYSAGQVISIKIAQDGTLTVEGATAPSNP